MVEQALAFHEDLKNLGSKHQSIKNDACRELQRARAEWKSTLAKVFDYLRWWSDSELADEIWEISVPDSKRLQTLLHNLMKVAHLELSDSSDPGGSGTSQYTSKLLRYLEKPHPAAPSDQPPPVHHILQSDNVAKFTKLYPDALERCYTTLCQMADLEEEQKEILLKARRTTGLLKEALRHICNKERLAAVFDGESFFRDKCNKSAHPLNISRELRFAALSLALDSDPYRHDAHTLIEIHDGMYPHDKLHTKLHKPQQQA